MKTSPMLCAFAAALSTAIAAHATSPALAPRTATVPAPVNRLSEIDVAPGGVWTPLAEPRRVDDPSKLALWTYCGWYTMPNGNTGIKCYTL